MSIKRPASFLSLIYNKVQQKVAFYSQQEKAMQYNAEYANITLTLKAKL
jgi:hypothetical protein